MGTLAKILGSPPKPTDPMSAAIARKLGVDTPEGLTAFYSSFKSSYPTNISQQILDMYPVISQEMRNNLSGPSELG